MAQLNDGSPTHTNRTTGKGTAPDTSFVHSAMLDKCTWETVNEFGSDHLPILIEYEDQIPEVNVKPKYRWRMREANWSKFTAEIENKIPSRYEGRDLNVLEKSLRRIIKKAAHKHVGKKKIAQRNRTIMTPEIKEAIEKRNELRTKISTNREEWIQACRTSAELIQEEKERRWKEYVSELQTSKGYGKQ